MARGVLFRIRPQYLATQSLPLAMRQFKGNLNIPIYVAREYRDLDCDKSIRDMARDL